MKQKTIAIILLVTSLGCVRPPPDWREHQDLTIQMPSPGGNTKIDMVVDGPTLQALRLAADDFAPPSSEPRACADTQVAHLYRVSHRENIIFVEVLRDPAACGGQGHTLDGAGAYAISRDGRILRRVLDGDETNAWPDDAGTWRDVPTTPDGRPMFESTAIIDLRYMPLWMFDGGIPADVLANVVVIWPDGGVSVPDGGVWPDGRVSMSALDVPIRDGGVAASNGGTPFTPDAGAAPLRDAGATSRP